MCPDAHPRAQPYPILQPPIAFPRPHVPLPRGRSPHSTTPKRQSASSAPHRKGAPRPVKRGGRGPACPCRRRPACRDPCGHGVCACVCVCARHASVGVQGRACAGLRALQDHVQGGHQRASMGSALGHDPRPFCAWQRSSQSISLELASYPPSPLVQATVNDQKLTEPTPSVAWTRALLRHRTTMVVATRSHSGNTQFIAMNTAPEAPPQIVHRLRCLDKGGGGFPW